LTPVSRGNANAVMEKVREMINIREGLSILEEIGRELDWVTLKNVDGSLQSPVKPVDDAGFRGEIVNSYMLSPQL
jgi:hypothetical protein